MKRVFKVKQKAVFIVFKGLSMKQMTHIFLEGESPTLSRETKKNLLKQREKFWPRKLETLKLNGFNQELNK